MMALRLSRGCRCPRIHFSRRLSSSSVSSSGGGEGGGENDENPPPPPPPPPPSFSSYLSDVKASLLRQSPPRDPSSSFSRPPVPPSLLSPKPSKVESLEEIRKNLSEFRRRSAAPIQSDGKDGSHPKPISFQGLYKSKVIGNNVDDGKHSLESIRESLRNLRSSRGGSEMTTPSAFSLESFKGSLKLKPPPQTQTPGSHFLGEEGSLPHSIFGKELEGKKTESESRALKTEFVKMYTYNELGKKLKLLRPPAAAAAKKDWFSLEELNERLIKLREMEVKEMESWAGGAPLKDLRDCLLTLRKTSDESSKKSAMLRLALLGQLGGQVTPSFMLSPPKDHLVEKYFHPDNMSSAEKLKLELKRVRDEFKMSESDCGSSRVQVAQLTTKIKHLSSALHKKDKHSRKGLQAMVQRRKKILKYLRRTDWDSYCLVLSKLGLRDNPDYKN